MGYLTPKWKFCHHLWNVISNLYDLTFLFCFVVFFCLFFALLCFVLFGLLFCSVLFFCFALLCFEFVLFCFIYLFIYLYLFFIWFSVLFFVLFCFDFVLLVVYACVFAPFWLSVYRQKQLNHFSECFYYVPQTKISHGSLELHSWVNDDRIVIFGWTIPFNIHASYAYICA